MARFGADRRAGGKGLTEILCVDAIHRGVATHAVIAVLLMANFCGYWVSWFGYMPQRTDVCRKSDMRRPK
jgi:hypothetical protein